MDYRRNYRYQRNHRLTEAEDDFDELAKKYGIARNPSCYTVMLDFDDVAELLTLHTAFDFAYPEQAKDVVLATLKARGGRATYDPEELFNTASDIADECVDGVPTQDDLVDMLDDENRDAYGDGEGDLDRAYYNVLSGYVEDGLPEAIHEAFSVFTFALGCTNVRYMLEGLELVFSTSKPGTLKKLVQILDKGTRSTYSGQLKDTRLAGLYSAVEEFMESDDYGDFTTWELQAMYDIESYIEDGWFDDEALNNEFRKTINTNESYRRRYGRRIYEGRSIYRRTPSTSRRYTHRR